MREKSKNSSGPSLYIKRANLQNISSVSSSFKHFDGGSENTDKNVYQIPTNSKDIGTLDRNFFTKTNFNYENHLMITDYQEDQNESNSNKSNTLESKEKEAISQLESILY
ncbi:hypothetical protein GWI33_018600 [Rhynchophorus ferrugineus]|uniref:Uncharacterized protein n=1 Tax=Rhynchophorus ferrugineus TaxID=354439 RepID=A0A834HW00_RHYFE|nr:hypothetical protein GWI33_018600 [Rhynchophorus ferrugineus]